MSNSFYDAFASEDFFEKTAMENKNINESLNEIDPSVLEKVAAELGAMSESEDMTTLQEKLAADCSGSQCSTSKSSDNKKCAEDDEDEEDYEDDDKKKCGACGSGKKCAEDNKKCAEDEEYCEDDDKKKCGACGSDKKCAEDNKKCAEDEEYYDNEYDENDKQAADYTEEEILKQAYEIAEQKLASEGLGTIDYVFSKVASDESLYGLANEESCAFIADKAEKLASLSEKTALEVVDDILVEVAGKLQ